MRIILTIILISICVKITAQDYIFNAHYNFPVNEENLYFTDINTSLKLTTGSENSLYDSLIFNSYPKKELQAWKRKLFYEHLIISKSDKYKIIINPVFDFRYNKSTADNITGFLNTRGFSVFGKLDQKIWFNTGFLENQGVFPSHINEFYSTYLVIPGYSRIKPYQDNGFDFASAWGNISFKPISTLTFSLGTDRMFIGDGYRSLLLSDFACPFLYFKTSFRYGNLGFNHIITQALNPNLNNIMDLDGNWGLNNIYPGKLISYNYLTWNIRPYFQLGLFEAIIFDATEQKIWNTTALNPVPYLNTSIYGFNDVNNSLAGLNLMYQNSRYGILYSQILIDNPDFSGKNNRLAWQLGYKNFSLFSLENLFVQMEYNHVDVLCYTHHIPQQHYGQFNQTLAHPAGHGFDELVFITKYSFDRFTVFTKLNFLQYKFTGDYDFKNIFNQQDYHAVNIFVSSGDRIINSDTQIIYTINPAIGMQAFAGIIYRQNLNSGDANTFIQFGLRTALRANYYDF
jgi:hypothetical protein